MNYNQCYLNFKDLVKDFWGPKFKEKEMGGNGCLNINEVKDYFKDVQVP